MKKIDSQKIHYNHPLFKLLLAVYQLAYEMEVKWGRNTLDLIAGYEMVEKFVRAQDRMIEAINGGDYDTANKACENVKRGWRKLEEIAQHKGYDKMPDYLKLVNGQIEYWLVKDEIDGHILAARHPACASAIVTHAFVVEMLGRDGKELLRQRSPSEFEKIMMPRSMATNELLDDDIPW